MENMKSFVLGALAVAVPVGLYLLTRIHLQLQDIIRLLEQLE